MEGRDVNLVCIRANKRDEPFSHGSGAGVSEGKSENGGRVSISLSKNIGDASRDDLGFTSARTGDDHDRSLD